MSSCKTRNITWFEINNLLSICERNNSTVCFLLNHLFTHIVIFNWNYTLRLLFSRAANTSRILVLSYTFAFKIAIVVGLTLRLSQLNWILFIIFLTLIFTALIGTFIVNILLALVWFALLLVFRPTCITLLITCYMFMSTNPLCNYILHQTIFIMPVYPKTTSHLPHGYLQHKLLLEVGQWLQLPLPTILSLKYIFFWYRNFVVY